MIHKVTYLYIGLLTLTSCAVIPKQAVELNQMLMVEAHNIHQLNKALLKDSYEGKIQQLEIFFAENYLPVATLDLVEAVKSESDDSAEIISRLTELIPLFAERAGQTQRDLQKPLDKQYEEISESLDERYEIYRNSSEALNDLLISAVKVNEEWQNAKYRLQGLTKSDLSALESKYNEIIEKIGASSIDYKGLENEINKLTKRK